MATMTVTVGDRTFQLDETKAREAVESKSVINGRETANFNILPLKYVWAYDLYRTMKANHWEPEDIPMGKDIEQWRSPEITDIERWIIRMGIGYFSAAEGIVGDNIQHVVRELVTASELKLLLGRHAHEENIHADSLLYMISSLGINPHECEAMFDDVETIKKKNAFVQATSQGLRRDMDLTKTEEKQALPRIASSLVSAWKVRNSTASSVWYCLYTAKTNSPVSDRCSVTLCVMNQITSKCSAIC